MNKPQINKKRLKKSKYNSEQLNAGNTGSGVKTESVDVAQEPIDPQP